VYFKKQTKNLQLNIIEKELKKIPIVNSQELKYRDMKLKKKKGLKKRSTSKTR
jgi:hypothetical protein